MLTRIFGVAACCSVCCTVVLQVRVERCAHVRIVLRFATVDGIAALTALRAHRSGIASAPVIARLFD
jgi:hypothetical protein